ncbi:hypothetical protein Belba_2894 [Belliella baltica DSM 15883]|uniref:Uncharacterized protein n=1 Tax=Belliella baltica (strain DSM 15883 / CIP 108006 / LMG 21964 / BA134) TaxID=866536 RepID=I3Z857_BELBD|nr:hypothetical protein [Belliella baltica]AFL85425.1 hypothetical protein Belba_2894 [Belliella baltica DSM 15883]
MDAGNIIYIIAVIIYFIYTAIKKGKKNEEENLPDQRNEEGPNQRPPSFEDLLREIRGGQQERERDLEQSGQGTVIENRKHVIKTPKIDQEKYQTSSDKLEKDNSSYSKYNQYSGSDPNLSTPKLQTLDEQVSISSSLTGLGVSETRSGKRKKPKSNRYQKMLSNPRSVKDAIILSEILNRKHF